MIEIVKKPEQKKVIATHLQVGQVYRVVEIRGGEEQDSKYMEVGDLLIRLPARTTHIPPLLNATKQDVMLAGGSNYYSGLMERTICVRDFTVQSIVLLSDNSELPA